MTKTRLFPSFVMTFLAGLLAASIAAQATDRMDAFIRSLPAEQRTRLIESYLYSGYVYSKFLKFRGRPDIYLSCADEACDPWSLSVLVSLRASAPLAVGALVDQADAAGIEIYVAPQPTAYETRDRAIDGRLHIDANITSKTISPRPNPRPAPCWTTTYFDFHTGVIEKSLIFIDSHAPLRMQASCLGFELVRAVGVINTLNVIFYRNLKNTEADSEARHWLAANAYLQGLPEIRPGDTMGKVQAVLNAKYEVNANTRLTSP